MGAPSDWILYNEAKLSLGQGKFNLTSDTIKMGLFTVASNCGDAALATAQYATLTGQHANQGAPGYATGGQTVAATWTGAGATKTFDTANASWTATGGSIVAYYAVLYSDTATNKDLIAYCLLDSAPASVTVTVGNILQVTVTNVFTAA
jgi:hypothetical protein